MHCRSCGTQLATRMAYCPACGTVTAYKAFDSEGSLYDQTTAASSSHDAPVQAPKSTDYGSPPYGVPLQNPYEPSSPYTVPPPPPRKSNVRIWITVIVVVVLLAATVLGVTYLTAHTTASGAITSLTPRSTGAVPPTLLPSPTATLPTAISPTVPHLLQSSPTNAGPGVMVSTGNGLYVSAELGYTGSSQGMLRARASRIGPWEQFSLKGSGGCDGLFALQSTANGLYVSVELGYTGSSQGMLRARASQVGPWEQFYLRCQPNHTYALQSAANGLYVSAELGYTGHNQGMLRARASQIGPWEQFL